MARSYGAGHFYPYIDTFIFTVILRSEKPLEKRMEQIEHNLTQLRDRLLEIDFLALAQTLGSEAIFALVGAGVMGLFVLYRMSRVKRAFKAGELNEEIIVVANIFEDLVDGSSIKVIHKPRTVQSAQPIMRAFPNQFLVQQIIAATKRCDPKSAEGSFIVLSDPQDHHIFMKRVVDIASELGGVGHVLRMCEREVVKHDCYVCVTFSPDGPHRKIRIDMISEKNLKRFLNPSFPLMLRNRPEEGSHADLAAIFEFGAQKVFANISGKDDARSYMRRVSIPTEAF